MLSFRGLRVGLDESVDFLPVVAAAGAVTVGEVAVLAKLVAGYAGGAAIVFLFLPPSFAFLAAAASSAFLFFSALRALYANHALLTRL